MAAPAGIPVAARLAASPAAQHRTALLLGCKLAHPPACGLFICSFISSRSLNERVCQNDNRTNSAKLTLRACFVKLTLRACSVKWPLPVCFFAGCFHRLFSPAARASYFCRLPVPAAPPRRSGQLQTSSGGEKYYGSASNLAHLGRIC